MRSGGERGARAEPETTRSEDLQRPDRREEEEDEEQRAFRKTSDKHEEDPLKSKTMTAGFP